MTSATIFNSSSEPLAIILNNGPQFQLPVASTPALQPGTAAVAWSDTVAAPNVLAPGPNQVSVTQPGQAWPANITVSVPDGVQWNSLQLYLFVNGYQDLYWVLLNAGQFVTGNAASAPMAGVAAPPRQSYLARLVRAILGRP